MIVQSVPDLGVLLTFDPGPPAKSGVATNRCTATNTIFTVFHIDKCIFCCKHLSPSYQQVCQDDTGSKYHLQKVKAFTINEQSCHGIDWRSRPAIVQKKQVFALTTFNEIAAATGNENPQVYL